MSTAERPTPPRRDVVTGYYLATPVFVVIDLAMGLPVRVAGLESTSHRVVYYVVLIAFGLICRAKPAAAPWIGMIESAGNIFLLCLAILLPVWALPEAFESGAELVSPFDKTSLATVLISGTAFIVSFYRNQAAALSGPKRRRSLDLEGPG